MNTDRENRASDPDGSEPKDHPSPDVLLAYHERALGAEEADRIQEHLVACTECAQVILDFAAFPRVEPREESHRMSPEELDDQWLDLEREIRRRRQPWWQRREILLPLAAIFFLAAVGLGAWSMVLRQRLQALRGPSGDVLVTAELWPGGDQTRGGREAIELPGWARRVVVQLSVPSATDFERYGVDVYGAGGTRVVTGFPVHADPDGLFSVELPRSALTAGEARIELFGLTDGRRVLVAQFPFAVEIGGT